MRVHLMLPIDADDFDQWLSLFEATVNDLCTPVAAKHFMERARRIAQSLEMGVAMQADAMPERGQRYRRNPTS